MTPTLAGRPGLPSAGSGGSRCRLDVKVEHAGGVTPHDLPHHVGGQMAHHVLGHLSRVGPCGVGMRVVGFESDVVHPHRIEGVQTVAVAEEATE